MTKEFVIKMGLIFALLAEMEGMKAENMVRYRNGNALAYDEIAFQEIANKIREIVYE